jgi:hypothetical protein
MEKAKNSWLQDTMDVFGDLLNDVKDDSPSEEEQAAAQEELCQFVRTKLIESYKNGAKAEWRKHQPPRSGAKEERG